MTPLSTAAASALMLTAAALLAGCCGSRNCDTCDALSVGDIQVFFRTDTLGGAGFRRAELRDAYLVRYASRNLSGATDTIRQGARPGREPLSFYGSSFGFRQLPPPASLQPPAGAGSSATSFDPFDYSYRVVVPATSQQFAFSELETVVEQGKGCCACARNVRRRFVLNGQYTVADGDAGATTYLGR